MNQINKNIALIGAPTDVGTQIRGCSLGPDALRVAEIHERLVDRGLTVSDIGNLQGPVNPKQQPKDGYRHFDEVVAWSHIVHDAMYEQLKADTLPILMGGDHFLALPSISAVARHCREKNKKLRILWLDAHTDFNTCDLTPSGNIHGMPVACLCGFGAKELISLSDTVPAINTSDIRQIGIRSVDDGEREFVHEQNLEVFDMRYIDENGIRKTMEQALKGIDDNTHIHVSFDVDFLDPSFAPAVGTTVEGGVNYREAQLCMEMIADTGLLGSLDLVELNPALDERNRTAQVMVQFVESLFGKSTLVRK